jgi:hypothetical protein
MGAHASENDYDDGEGSAEDSPTQQGGGMTRGISTASRTQVAQDMDDDIPFRQAPASSNTASRGNVGAVTDPADIPL